MKPSERRALEAEKRAQREAEMRERELEIGKAASSAPRASNYAADGRYERKEGFFQSHVRIITFIICMVLILTVLGPWGIDKLVEKGRNKVVNDQKDMTVDTIYMIWDNVGEITFSSFDNFNYTDLSYDSKNGEYFVREFPIENTDLVLKVGGADMNKAPDYAYLIHYDRDGSSYIDVMKENPREFLEDHLEGQTE